MNPFLEKIASKVAKFGRKGLLASSIAATLTIGEARPALAWSSKGHIAVASAVKAEKPFLATLADMPVPGGTAPLGRKYIHYLDAFDAAGKPLEADLDRAVNLVFETGKENKYDAMHLIVDYSQPFHAGAYEGWNKRWHSVSDKVADGINLSSLRDVPASTGDIRTNIRNLLTESNAFFLKLKAEDRMMTSSEAFERLKKATAITRQMFPNEFVSEGKQSYRVSRGSTQHKGYIQKEYNRSSSVRRIVEKHYSNPNVKIKNKISGHRPGWATTVTEETIKSDFEAGRSYHPRTNLSERHLLLPVESKLKMRLESEIPGSFSYAKRYMTHIKSGLRAGEKATRAFISGSRKGLLSVALAGSMLFGGAGIGHAAVNETVAKRIRGVTDYVAEMVSKDKPYQKDVSNLLFDTASQESGQFEHSRQLAWETRKVTRTNSKGKKYTRNKRFLTESGIGRSKWSIEPATGHDLVHWSQAHKDAMEYLKKSSGLTEKELVAKTTDEIAALIQGSEKYAATSAWVKYMSKNVTAPSMIEEEASLAAKKYYVGRKEGRAALQEAYKKNFIKNATAAREGLKASNVVAALQSNIGSVKAANPIKLAGEAIAHNRGNATVKGVEKMAKTLLRR